MNRIKTPSDKQVEVFIQLYLLKINLHYEYMKFDEAQFYYLLFLISYWVSID